MTDRSPLKHSNGELEYRKYDDQTGALTMIVRNADPGNGTSPWNTPSLTIMDYGLTGTNWTALESDRQMRTRYEVDLLGRITKSIAADDSEIWIERHVRYEPLKRPWVPLLATVSLPPTTGSTPPASGPIRINWTTATGNNVRSSSYVTGTTYTPPTTFTIARDNERARQVNELSLSGTTTISYQWTDVPASGSLPGGDEFYGAYEESYEFDALGRLTKLTDAESGFTERTYDVRDRVTETWIGLGSTSHKVQSIFYDGTHASASHGVGNGLVTLVQDYDGVNDRDTKHWYDWRERRIGTRPEIAPFWSFEYDNLDRPVASAGWKEVSGKFTNDTESTVPDPDAIASTTDRVHLHRLHYSRRGHPFQLDQAIDPADTATGYLSKFIWHDELSRPIATWPPNGPATKTTYDALGRISGTYMTDRAGDAAPGASGNYSAAATLTGDHVIEQLEYRYTVSSEYDQAQLDLVTSRQRLHDDTTSTGVLTNSSSVATFVGYHYDDAGRQTHTLNYGTNTGNDIFESGGTAPSVPYTTSRSSNSQALITSVEFDDWGRRSASVSPEGTRTEFKLDALSRQIAVIEAANNVDADDVSWSSTNSRWQVTGVTLADDEDRVTTFVYDGLSNVTKRTAHMPSPANDQTTEYVYGTTAPSSPGDTDSLVASSRLLKEVRYAGSTGEPGTTSTDKVLYAYNRQHELRAMTDQNGTVHLYGRDLLGRLEVDQVDTLGTNIDGAIRRIESTFDDAGRVETVISYDATTGGDEVNGVKFAYSGMHSVTEVRQHHDDEPTATGNKLVEYEYASATPSASGGNYHRIDDVYYPAESGGSTPTLEYTYDSGIDDLISRVSSISANDVGSSTALAAYDYLGTGMTARVRYPSTVKSSEDLRLDRTIATNGDSTSGDYPGYDEYGRVIWHAWVREGITPQSSPNDHLPDRTPLVARVYEYDKDSNRTLDYDGRPGANLPTDRDWEYTYEPLDRLQETVRGSYNTSTQSMTPAVGSQEWALDVLGNWDTWTIDEDGVSPIVYNSSDHPEDRTHNPNNEITEVSITQDPPLGPLVSQPTYDDTGNFRSNDDSAGAGVFRYTYDAWNRLVKVERWSSSPFEIATYEYNGLHWRVERKADTAKGAHDGIDEHRIYTYSPSWQIIEEWVDNDPDLTTGFDGTANHIAQQFWGLRYIDDAVARRIDRNADGDWTDEADEVFYYLTDALFSTRAMTTADGSVWERIDYTPYGEAIHRYGWDLDENGVWNVDDSGAFGDAWGTSPGDADYDPDADYDGNGVWNLDDTGMFGTLAGLYSTSTQPEQWLSDPADTSGTDNQIGYAGYRFNPETEHYHVRYRVYSPYFGLWLQPDPINFADGSNYYSYVSQQPAFRNDPFGLRPGVRPAPTTRPTPTPTWPIPGTRDPYRPPVGPNPNWWHHPYGVPPAAPPPWPTWAPPAVIGPPGMLVPFPGMPTQSILPLPDFPTPDFFPFTLPAEECISVDQCVDTCNLLSDQFEENCELARVQNERTCAELAKQVEAANPDNPHASFDWLMKCTLKAWNSYDKCLYEMEVWWIDCVSFCELPHTP